MRVETPADIQKWLDYCEANPYLRLIKEAVLALGLSPENQPSKDTVESWIRIHYPPELRSNNKTAKNNGVSKRLVSSAAQFALLPNVGGNLGPEYNRGVTSYLKKRSKACKSDTKNVGELPNYNEG